MGREFEGKTGYVEVRDGGRLVYSGYYLNGKLFVVDAPALNRIWYKGLLSDHGGWRSNRFRWRALRII